MRLSFVRTLMGCCHFQQATDTASLFWYFATPMTTPPLTESRYSEIIAVVKKAGDVMVVVVGDPFEVDSARFTDAREVAIAEELLAKEQVKVSQMLQLQSAAELHKVRSPEQEQQQHPHTTVKSQQELNTVIKVRVPSPPLLGAAENQEDAVVNRCLPPLLTAIESDYTPSYSHPDDVYGSTPAIPIITSPVSEDKELCWEPGEEEADVLAMPLYQQILVW
jgi:hypothetical protein